MDILKLIGMLLEYPDEALWQHQDEVRELIAQKYPALSAFTQRYLATAPLDVQSDWCALFERGRATSLLLFEHVHAESRDRGQAMVDLLTQYEQAGLELSCRELPDHLPLYLEYLSQQDEQQARQGLNDIAPILALLGGRLKERDSDFSQLFDALLNIARSPLNSESVAQQVATEPRDDSREALDAVWEEEQIKFIDDKACNHSELHQHQRRFSQDTGSQYLDMNAGGAR